MSRGMEAIDHFSAVRPAPAGATVNGIRRAPLPALLRTTSQRLEAESRLELMRSVVIEIRCQRDRPTLGTESENVCRRSMLSSPERLRCVGSLQKRCTVTPQFVYNRDSNGRTPVISTPCAQWSDSRQVTSRPHCGVLVPALPPRCRRSKQPVDPSCSRHRLKAAHI